MRDGADMSFEGDWFSVLWEQLALNGEFGAVTDLMRREWMIEKPESRSFREQASFAKFGPRPDLRNT